MRWDEFAAAQPRFAQLARDRLVEPRVVLMGTTRRDGTPRVSGVEPLILEGDLWFSMLGSTKVADLRRDPRVLVRSVITKPVGEVEILVRGTAREVRDPEVQAHYAGAAAATLGWRPVVGQFALFAIDVEDVSCIRFDPETGDQHVARWPAGVEYRRRNLTPTSYGAREPVTDLLV